MLISHAMHLFAAISSVRSFPTTESLIGCVDMPSSYNFSAAEEELPIDDIINDISSFASNFSKRFAEMNAFINENKNRTRDLDINYFLFTPLNPDVPETLEPTKESLSNSDFNSYLPTTVVVHGYTRTVDIINSTLSVMKDFLLKRSAENIILMDYTKYCQGPYTEAVQNSYLVAMNLAYFVQFISENSFTTIERFHLIGISLGAQISGNAGALIPGLGRITGLDPAGPLFEIFPSNYRLSNEDALFVEAIHTGAATFPQGMGIPYPVGDVDFYPNGGKYQPGCNIPENFTSSSVIGMEVVNAIRCCHSRAVFLFLESFCNTECQFVGINCDNYTNFQNGRCSYWNSATATLGMNVEKHESLLTNTKFYLDTNSKFPYCKLQ